MAATPQMIAIADLEKILELAVHVPVFPCNRNKAPLTKNGFHDASQDFSTIRNWWKSHPDALVGVPTGKKSGLVVIDYDPDKADDAGAEFIRENAFYLAGTVSHHTRRAGGRHYLFRAPLDADYTSGKDIYIAGRKRLGIDVRAEGGYIIWWPLHGAQKVGERAAQLPAGLIPDRRRNVPSDRSIPAASGKLLAHAKDWKYERQRVIDALAHVDPSDRDQWVKMGQAVNLASGGDEDGFGLWHAWSAGGLTGNVPDTYVSENDCRYAWASFNKRTEGRELVTLGTLFATAKQNGYQSATTPPIPDDGRFAPFDPDVYTDLPPELDPEEWSEPQPEMPSVAQEGRAPIQWSKLDGLEPPIRQWAVEGWLGRGHVTLLAGPPGSGKTAVCQAIGSAVSLGRQVIDNVPRPMVTLFWAGEDEEDELWRRQISIARWLGEPLTAFDGRMVMQPYPDRDISVCALAGGTLVETPMLKELRDQIGDYKAELVFLDSVARLFGGDENNRHQVTQFIAWLTWALKPTNAAICLLGHPAKAAGSEFSGSTAWEASVRARLYFGKTLPDKAKDDDSEPDPDQRWLAKRKTNYSGTDIREVRWIDGVMAPSNTPIGDSGGGRLSNEFLMDETLRIFRRLNQMGIFTGPSPGANYLPRVAVKQRLLEGAFTERDLRTGLAELMKAGRIKVGVVGTYANRNPRMGLLEG